MHLTEVAGTANIQARAVLSLWQGSLLTLQNWWITYADTDMDLVCRDRNWALNSKQSNGTTRDPDSRLFQTKGNVA